MPIATRFFPLVAAAASALALCYPTLFSWFGATLVKIFLALVMFFTSLSLSVADFTRVLYRPVHAATGFVLQYTVMPTLGFATAKLFALPEMVAAGIILVSCCPGGTASNVITYLAGGDVPLSVTMTASSTLAAPLMTPLLATWLIGKSVPVDAVAMAKDTAVVILLPVALALLSRRFAPTLRQRLLPQANLFAVVAITMIVTSIIARSRDAILSGGMLILVAVVFLHSGGFLFGYALARLLRLSVIPARTIAIEVGMQNSGLGVVLATAHIGHAAAVPCAISSLVHSLIGSLLAAYWRRPTAAAETS